MKKTDTEQQETSVLEEKQAPDSNTEGTLDKELQELDKESKQEEAYYEERRKERHQRNLQRKKRQMRNRNLALIVTVLILLGGAGYFWGDQIGLKDGVETLVTRAKALIPEKKEDTETAEATATPVPEKESIRSLAAHQATMVLFLSTSLTEQLQKDLLAGGYAETTPAAVVYKATWRDQKIFRCTVGTLHKTVTQNGLTKTSLIVVGGCLGGEYMRSLLYHPGFSTEFREASE